MENQYEPVEYLILYATSKFINMIYMFQATFIISCITSPSYSISKQLFFMQKIYEVCGIYSSRNNTYGALFWTTYAGHISVWKVFCVEEEMVWQ